MLRCAAVVSVLFGSLQMHSKCTYHRKWAAGLLFAEVQFRLTAKERNERRLVEITVPCVDEWTRYSLYFLSPCIERTLVSSTIHRLNACYLRTASWQNWKREQENDHVGIKEVKSAKGAANWRCRVMQQNSGSMAKHRAVSKNHHRKVLISCTSKCHSKLAHLKLT